MSYLGEEKYNFYGLLWGEKGTGERKEGRRSERERKTAPRLSESCFVLFFFF
jgi:hypothetical protein